MLWLLLSCADPVDPPVEEDAVDVVFGRGLFVEGCPLPGESSARIIGVNQFLPGFSAVGTKGDALLFNERVAFAITAPGKPQSTYWYYKGALADAVPMNGCEPATDDQLDEVATVIGQLELTAFQSSILRGFQAHEVYVVNDGTDGQPAVVRAHGSDATHWLVEYELIKSEPGRPFSDDFGLDVTLDYILPPDSNVLTLELTIANPTDTPRSLVAAHLMNFGPWFEVDAYASSELSIDQLDLGLGMPWVAATNEETSYAFAPESANLAYTGIAGIQVAVDLTQPLVDPIEVGPGESDTRRFFFAVGDGPGSAATSALSEVNPEPVPGETVTTEVVTGTVRSSNTGVAGAIVALETKAGEADWGALDRAITADDGSYTLHVPRFPSNWEMRVHVRADGRDPTEPVELPAGRTKLDLDIGGVGTLDYVLTEDGADSPARIELRRDDGKRESRWVVGTGSTPLEPGTWDYTVTRGYEFAPVTGSFTLLEDGSRTLEAELVRIVDTRDWMAIDTHIHSAWSPDSPVPPLEQMTHGAAHGLDIYLATEHEVIADMRGPAEAAGLTEWMYVLSGQEVTASMPEHMTMLPVVADGSPRGGYVEWYRLDVAGLWGAMRERSGGVNLFNHPGYLDRIGWDRVMAEPTLSDPTLLGLEPDKDIWSWDLDGVEVQNGHGNPFIDGNRRFDNWQSFGNAGHPVIAVGCSDSHGGDDVGFPRTYLQLDTDRPRAITDDQIADVMLEGRAIVSAGAFARVDVDGAGVGELADGSNGTVDLSLHIEAMPEIEVTHAVVFANCDEVAQLDADDPDGIVKLDAIVPLDVHDEDLQIVVAGFGSKDTPDGLPNPGSKTPRVLTNAIFVDSDGNGAFDAPGGRECDYDITR